MATRQVTSRRFGISISVALFAAAAALAGCQGSPDDTEEESVGEAQAAVCQNQSSLKEGKRLYEKETFGGNGRTCATCHSKKTGTVSPADAQARFVANPNDPLFIYDGSDDFQGNGATRMLDDATVLVRVKLPPFITLADDPAATSVVLVRGIPSTINTPALDPVLMVDGRAPNLVGQASDAIHGHAQSTVEPTAQQLALIAAFEKSDDFFSSDDLEDFADGGDAPKLPKGHSAAEKRGRTWFEDAPVPAAINSSTSRKGLCALCHSGPMLNTSNGFNPLPVAPFPKFIAPGVPDPNAACNVPAQTADHVAKGTRFQSVLVSELAPVLNPAKTPIYNFVLHTPDGQAIPLPPMADPGRALITGNFAAFPVPGADLFNFKIPSLWGVKSTAPYFHDNSAKSLEETVEHYATFIAIATGCAFDGDPPLVMTAQDKKDLVAFLKLL